MDTPNNSGTYNAPSKKSNSWIYMLVIALLLVLNVIQFFQSRNQRSDLTVLSDKIIESDSAQRILEQEYRMSLARLDDLIGQNSKLDSMINQKDTELARTKERINEILAKQNASKTELLEAKSLITSLNAKIVSFENEIKVLKTENAQLKVQKDSIIVTNQELEKKVEIAKVLNASNIRLVAINQRRGGAKENETSKASKADMLRLTFDIDRNYLAEDGSNDLYIRIIAPSGELLSNHAYGSGSFVLHDGSPMYYSVSKVIKLESGIAMNNVSVDWQQAANYQKGYYNVEIFHRGYVIGNGNVYLK